MRAQRRSAVPFIVGFALLLGSTAALSAGAASATPALAGDEAPPKATTQNFSPRAVDLAGGPKDVVVTVSVTDDTGVATPTAGLRSVNSTDILGFGPMTRVSGTATKGTYERRITVPKTGARSWFVVVNPLADTLGNTETSPHPDYSTLTGYDSSVQSAPTAPSAISGFPGNGMASVYCMGGPAYNGGAPITAYRLTATPGGQTITSDTCNLLMKGLTNGVTYTFTLAAVNSRGVSEESRPSNPMTPQFALSRTPVPLIRGVAKVGYTLTAYPLTWQPAPVTLAYRWYRVDPTGKATAIYGAAHPTYKVAAADRGYQLSVTVTGSKEGYPSVARASEPTVVVPGAITTAPVPTVSGTAKVGSTLTATPGTWEPAPVTLAYRWYKFASTGSASPIYGAAHSTYTAATTDRGYRLKVVVTGSKPGYQSVLRTSAVTAAVAR